MGNVITKTWGVKVTGPFIRRLCFWYAWDLSVSDVALDLGLGILGEPL